MEKPRQCATCAYWAIGKHDYMMGLCAIKEHMTWYDHSCGEWKNTELPNEPKEGE